MSDDAARRLGRPSGVSVVVPARNRADVIARQLDALAGQTSTLPFEVVVVDNGSSDATASVTRAFRDRFESLEVIEATQRRGAAHARNVGVHAAAGELLAFCDSDDVVHAGWIDALVSAWSPGTLVAGRIHRLQVDDDSGLPGLPTQPARPRPPLRGFLPFADSANLAIGRRDFDSIGGLDESYRFSADVDLSWRAQLAGVRFVQAPEAIVFKRPSPPGWIRFRQYHRWGRATVQLYGTYRAQGMPRRPSRAIARSWTALGAHALRSVVDPSRRDAAVRQTGWCTGYALGSLRYRVLYL